MANGILDTIASKAFPIGNFENIRTSAPNQMSYNIDATRDLVKNQPFNPFAPSLAATMSLPYDVIQGIGRAFKGFEPQTGIMDYDDIPDAPTFADIGKSIAAENPIDSLIGRTAGATLGLADKMTDYGKSLASLFDTKAMAKEPTVNVDSVKSAINAAKVREALNKAGIMSLDDAGLITEPYETFAEKAKPGFNLPFAKQIGATALSVLTGNPLVGLLVRGLGALAGRGGLTGIKGGVDLRGDTGFDTFRRSTSLANFAQRMRDKRAREDAARRGSLKELQTRIDRGDFDGPTGPGAAAAANQDAARGGQYSR
tara:strand:+ start:72 stop:1010 length:939 start_codon:yes stop_codon:yes gene_type:complete